MSATIAAPNRERLFYSGMALAIFCAILYGFYHSYFLYHWYPDWHVPPERYFWLHGTLMIAWFTLLVVQPLLIASGRRDLHMRLGRLGAGLAVLIVLAMGYGALVAAVRPGGFIDVPIPALQFLAIPIFDLLVFALFIGFALLNVREPQRHKRWMLLASIGILDAAIARWQIGPELVTTVQMFVLQDCFLLPLLGWDLASRGRPHPVTVIGAVALLISQPLRLAISGTDAWLSFARMLTSLLG